MTDFMEKFSMLRKEKNSILCVGLDPALPRQRSENVIPLKYLKNVDENEAKLNFCLDIIEQTSDFCIAAKVNEQYVLGFTPQQHRKLTDFIGSNGLLSIYDCKLNEIGDTAESALFYHHEWRYDAITVSPFPGNLKEIVSAAHKYQPEIGILALTIMSNPEATKYMKNAKLSGKPIYAVIAEEIKECGADGCVVGVTAHITEDDIKLIRTTVGEDRILLIPGVGAQRGDPEKAIKAGGESILINVSRDLIYSNDPRGRAEEYCKMFNELRRKLS
jgi:orotidine-5'-phosphate decarboxylase